MERARARRPAEGGAGRRQNHLIMTDRPEIWFGDLMRVWRELRPGADIANQIARALGISHAGAAVDTTERAVGVVAPTPDRGLPSPVQPDETPWAPPAPQAPTPTVLEPVGTAPWPEEVDWSGA